MQGIISSPHLATKLLCDVSQWWIHYLNRCMSASASKVVEAPGASVRFSLKPILVEMEGGRYIVLTLPVSLVDLVTGRRPAIRGVPQNCGGGRNGGSGGNKKPLPKVDATGEPAQVRARYDAHLPSLSLRDGDNSRSILAGAVLSTLKSHVLGKN